MNQIRHEFTIAQNKELRNEVKQDKNRLAFHLMPPVGWLNDPNGLCQFNGTYHIFYQYTPGNPTGADHRGWGHYTTKDFIHYQEENDPFVPDSQGDGKGSYSGSAFIQDGTMHLFYTGNNKLQGDYDYINNGRIHWVMHSTSRDGLHFSPKEVLLKNKDYPQNLSCHVRDPKVIKRDNAYYMVLGARTKDSCGQAEIFKSTDLLDWKHASTITPKERFGYMWECPDLIELNGCTFLFCCPQGVKQDGYNYQAIYQNGWFELNESLDVDQQVAAFHEMDRGFDFYAPQSFVDESGRRILIGWMGLPDVDYTSPTIAKNWQHALTMPRELTLKEDKIYAYPIKEIEALRKTHTHSEGELDCMMGSAIGELQLKPLTNAWTISLRSDCTMHYDGKLFTFTLGPSGFGRTARYIETDRIDSLSIWSDTSALEIFINNGEYTLTSKLFDEADQLNLKTDAPMIADYYEYSSFEISEKLNKEDPTVA